MDSGGPEGRCRLTYGAPKDGIVTDADRNVQRKPRALAVKGPGSLRGPWHAPPTPPRGRPGPQKRPELTPGGETEHLEAGKEARRDGHGRPRPQATTGIRENDPNTCGQGPADLGTRCLARHLPPAARRPSFLGGAWMHRPRTALRVAENRRLAATSAIPWRPSFYGRPLPSPAQAGEDFRRRDVGGECHTEAIPTWKSFLPVKVDLD